MIIKGLFFKCTCGACPEQYDVLNDDNEIVGYVRLRYGWLTCEYPDVGGECIYMAEIGDGCWTGIFENEEQRMYHLDNIAYKILEQIKKTKETE